MKYIVSFILGCLLLITVQSKAQNKTMETAIISTGTIYQFKVKDLYGNDFDFATLKGKKILIVNTASECGLTPQYQDLESIY